MNRIGAKAKNVKDLQSMSDLSEDDMNVLTSFQEEYSRKANYKLIFPRENNISTYAKYFESLRYNNVLLWKGISSKTIKLE